MSIRVTGPPSSTATGDRRISSQLIPADILGRFDALFLELYLYGNFSQMGGVVLCFMIVLKAGLECGAMIKPMV